MFSTASWFGGLDQPVDIYCERTSAAWDAEPLNAISNIAFLVAAWAVWRLQVRRPNTQFKPSIEALALIILIVGIGSATFHTVATRWAEWADVIPILIFMIVYLWLILSAFFQWSFAAKLVTALAFFAVTFFLESDAFENILWGGAMYLPTLAFMLVLGAALWRRDEDAGKSFFGAASLFVLSFAMRTIDEPLCSEISIGTHYFWHIFNAAVLYLLVRTLILHAPGGEEWQKRSFPSSIAGTKHAA